MKQLEIGSNIPLNVIPISGNGVSIDVFVIIGVIVLVAILLIILKTQKQ